MPDRDPRRPLKVLIDGRTIADAFPGIGRATFNLVLALARTATHEDISLLVRTSSAARRHDLARLAATGGCRLLATSVPRSLPSELSLLPPLIRRLDPHVFHAPFFLRPYGIGRPCVVTLYDLIPLHPAARAGPWLDRWVFRVGARLACRRSRAVLVPSRATADAVARWLPATSDKLVVAPLAADPRFTPRPAREVDELARRLRLPRPYVLHMGSRAPHKNTAGLLEAWTVLCRSLAPRPPSADLVVGGDAPGEAAAAPHVRLLGPVAEEDLPALYSGALLYVSPSHVEGFGMTVLEAMACGAPVVCGDGGSLEEVTGAAAHCVDTRDPEAMASALQLLLQGEERRRELARRGLERARCFSWERTADIVRSTYHRAAGR